MNNNNFDEIFESVKSQSNKKDTEDFLMKQLNSSQTKKLKEILGDPKALETLLSSPQAKELLKKFTEGKND